MKQHITVEQADELSLKEKKVLIKWLKKHKYYNVYATSEGRLLSIGQMIEFLDENLGKDIWVSRLYGFEHYLKGTKEQILSSGHIVRDPRNKKELCDALWDAVKEKLSI